MFSFSVPWMRRTWKRESTILPKYVVQFGRRYGVVRRLWALELAMEIVWPSTLWCLGGNPAPLRPGLKPHNWFPLPPRHLLAFELAISELSHEAILSINWICRVPGAVLKCNSPCQSLLISFSSCFWTLHGIFNVEVNSLISCAPVFNAIFNWIFVLNKTSLVWA